MRYCPNCGAEYLEGIERCVDCDVELVDEPVEIDEPLGWVDRFSGTVVLRILLIVLSVAGVIYAASGIVTAVLYLFLEDAPGDLFETIRNLTEIQMAAFRVGLACLGVLAGAVLLKRYGEPSSMSPLRSATTTVRILFWTAVIFATIWAVAGVMTSRVQTEQSFRSVQFSEGEQDEPSDWEFTLLMLQYAAFVAGSAAFAIMVAMYVRGQFKAPTDEDDQSNLGLERHES